MDAGRAKYFIGKWTPFIGRHNSSQSLVVSYDRMLDFSKTYYKPQFVYTKNLKTAFLSTTSKSKISRLYGCSKQKSTSFGKVKLVDFIFQETNLPFRLFLHCLIVRGSLFVNTAASYAAYHLRRRIHVPPSSLQTHTEEPPLV